MKTRIDHTIPLILILYGLLFIIPMLISSNFKLSAFLICWICLWSLLVLLGLWKIETIEISGSQLIKTNFLGLFKQTINLEKVIRYDKKVINSNHSQNPLNIVTLFSKNKRYLVYRQITILTKESGKMKLDERTINKEDFNILYDKIKKHTKNNK